MVCNIMSLTLMPPQILKCNYGKTKMHMTHMLGGTWTAAILGVPVNTLGILDMKLFTVRTGTPE